MQNIETSIVIPAFNTEKYVTTAVKSCLRQHAPEIPFEVIVVDDGSTDGTAEALHTLQKQHRDQPLQILEQENQGPSGAINTGVNHARGKNIIFCDADDLLAPNIVDLLTRALDTYRLATTEYSGFSTADNRPQILYKTHTKKFTNMRGDPDDIPLLRGNVIGHPKAVRKADFEAIGGMNGSLRWVQDYDLVLRIIFPKDTTYPWIVVGGDTPLYWYRHHAKQITTTDKTGSGENPGQIKEFEETITAALHRLGVSQKSRFTGRLPGVGYLWSEHIPA
jgi:glycosyltransferase involved in cell wall biosynthesis